MDENEIIGFGVERIHLFDRRTQKFTARCYDVECEQPEPAMDSASERTESRVSEERVSREQVEAYGIREVHNEDEVDMTQANNIDDLIS